MRRSFDPTNSWDDWGIKYILRYYQSDMNHLEETNDLGVYSKEGEEIEKTYEQMIKVLFTSKACYCGELFTLEHFQEAQRSHSFIPYDGSGEYLDWVGNELGPINWYDFEKVPVGTKFVAWYNK